MEFQEKRFIRRVLSRLARRLERFVGGQLINKSWKEGNSGGGRGAGGEGGRAYRSDGSIPGVGSRDDGVV